MACNTCTTACDIYPCYENLWLFKATVNADYLVVMTNMGSGRKVSESVRSDGEGFIILTNGTWDDFFHTNSQIKFEIFEIVGGSQTTNIPADFQVITGFSGGSYAQQDATVSTSLYDCIYVSFNIVNDVDGVSETFTDQYLFNTNA